jgi:hypothetical protein
MTAFLHSKFVAGALAGLLPAAAVDFHAFKTWQSFKDARAYDWNVALFRWCYGALMGGLTAVGYGALIS